MKKTFCRAFTIIIVQILAILTIQIQLFAATPPIPITLSRVGSSSSATCPGYKDPVTVTGYAYVICETGEEISIVEYERMLDEHVRAICAKRGYDHALVEKTGSEICVMSQEDITKYHEVNEEIVRTCPVKLVAMPDGESKRFVLKFAGRSSAGEAGICDVTVDLVKIDDKWQLHAVLYSDPILPGDDV